MWLYLLIFGFKSDHHVYISGCRSRFAKPADRIRINKVRSLPAPLMDLHSLSQQAKRLFSQLEYMILMLFQRNFIPSSRSILMLLKNANLKLNNVILSFA